MSEYTHKKTTLLRLIASGLRGAVKLLGAWPWALVIAFILSPIGPHLRWTYTYQDYSGTRVYNACSYVGSRGFVNYMRGDACPFMTIIDRRI